MERMKSIKDQLLSQVEGQMSDLRCVDTKELGEVIDMIKDLAEAMYYCSVTKAMEDAKETEEKRSTYYYMEKYLPYYPYGHNREDEYSHGRMYYDEKSAAAMSNVMSSGGASHQNYYEESYPMDFHDEREGKSGAHRKMYMESKQTHQDQAKKIQELESYMKELTNDMTEMIVDASPEEKAVLQRKLNTLVTKIQNV